jgi:hypothetical protein
MACIERIRQGATRGGRQLVIAFMLCALTGCWQEVEYTGPDPTTAAEAPTVVPSEPEELPLGTPSTPSTPAAMASDDETTATDTNSFANDFADSLAEPPASSPPETEGSVSLEEETGTAPTNDTVATDSPITLPLEEQPSVTVDKYAMPDPDASTLPTTSGTLAEDALTIPADIATPPEAAGEPPAAESTTETTESTEPSDVAESVTDGNARQSQGGSDAVAPSIIAVPADTAVAESAPPDTNGTNPRLAAWQLGSKLSLAALANDRDIAPKTVESALADSKELADRLETTVAELPERGLSGSDPASRQVLNYVIEQGHQIGRDLTEKYGPEAAALFEVAMKSNLLLVLYTPGSSSSDAIVAAISAAAPRAQLPAGLWQPLINMVTSQADGAEVRKAVRSFHAEVERHLADRAEQ